MQKSTAQGAIKVSFLVESNDFVKLFSSFTKFSSLSKMVFDRLETYQWHVLAQKQSDCPYGSI